MGRLEKNEKLRKEKREKEKLKKEIEVALAKIDQEIVRVRREIAEIGMLETVVREIAILEIEMVQGIWDLQQVEALPGGPWILIWQVIVILKEGVERTRKERKALSWTD